MVVAALNISPENLRRIHELLTEVLCIIADTFANIEVESDAKSDVTSDGKKRHALRQKRYRERHTVTSLVTADASLVTVKGEGGSCLGSVENREQEQESLGSSSLGKPSTRMPREAPEGFETFWQIYPKRENRKAAVTRYVTVLRSGVTALRICDAAKRYAQSVASTERQYIKAPDVWLNKGCYDDELPLANGQDAALDLRTPEERKADWAKTLESL